MLDLLDQRSSGKARVMKKTNIDSKKLGLNKETLMPLQSAELEGIHGGITPTVVPIATATIATASMIACQWVGNQLSVGPRC